VLDRQLHAGSEFGRRTALAVQERPVDLLDVNTSVLDRLNRIGDLHQLVRSGLRVGEGTAVDKFHHLNLPRARRANVFACSKGY
jgi:hypothetical protein